MEMLMSDLHAEFLAGKLHSNQNLPWPLGICQKILIIDIYIYLYIITVSICRICSLEKTHAP